ncbi:LPXTG cell wall anchor domain-containing protein [Streptomyces sp. V3I7]|uniref:LPXTG cell wall anchor domain-containing protein n=1 Tax=Streptomyces sp. V3I7 TaxID=3042278 RepID=UPI002785ADD1|nr:LPXTG cell wall anchor domain-containing protein [Streptomyces sp. V3I7]MDQ0992722.1 LPXTG-motif cell wall-anchored protein [Streptomyces sp. V3I7]
MSSARRPLLTATAAGTLLAALWFVPSANATQDATAQAVSSAASAPQVTQQARAMSQVSAESAQDAGVTGITGTAGTTAESATDGTRLADTGSFDTTPYVAIGVLLLGVGAGFVVYSVRRERLEF